MSRERVSAAITPTRSARSTTCSPAATTLFGWPRLPACRSTSDPPRSERDARRQRELMDVLVGLPHFTGVIGRQSDTGTHNTGNAGAKGPYSNYDCDWLSDGSSNFIAFGAMA